MTRIPVHTVDSAPEGSRDALKALEATFGKVLNIHGAMAHSPAVLETYVAIQRVLEDTGTLDKRLREVIALAVANVDECSYCQAAHTAGGKAAGLSEQETIDIRRGQVDDPKLQALVTLVREQAGERRPRAGQHLAGGDRRRLDRRRAHRDLGRRRAQPVHQLLQPPGRHRAGPAGSAVALS